MIEKSHKPTLIQKDCLISDFKRIGIAEGDHVAVALSFKSIGPVGGGPNTFIDALMDVIGPKGTLMMNAHTRFFPISEIDSDYVFDKSSPPITGMLPQKLLEYPGSIRSKHPTFSTVAVGHFANYLTEGHDECSNPYLPFEKLALIGGKCLFIGIDGRLVAVRHEAQRRAGLFVVPMAVGVKYKSENGETKLFIDVMPPCTKRLPELVPTLEEMQILKRGKIGNASSFIGFADRLIDSMSSILKQDPKINLCNDFFCLSCREIERRLDLPKQFGNRTFFQRSLRKVVNFQNKIILCRKYTRIHFRKTESPNVITIFLESGMRLISRFLNKIAR